jgi:uncharacterized protein (TIGR03086 family)
MSQEVIDRVSALIGQFDQRVQAASADDWTKQSPCDEWKARDVVVHVGNNLRGIAAGITGGESTDIGPDDDIVAAWNQSRDAFIGALSTGDLSTSLPGPMGPMPAEQLIGRLISTDILVHTWDLARAIGGDESLDPQAVEGAYSGLKPLDAMIRRPGVFGPKVDSAAGADTQTEFLNFLGRVV